MRKFIKVIAVSNLIVAMSAATATALSASQPAATTSNATLAQRAEQGTSTATQTFEDNGLKFDLKNCQRVQQTVTCNLLITNFGNPDRQVGLYGNHNYVYVPKPQIFDDSGNQYVVKQVQFGKEKSTTNAWTTLIKGIPVKATISFELPQEVTKLAVLEVVVSNDRRYSPDYLQGKAQFRDVDIVASNPSSVPRNTPKKKK
jgi:mRNA-degrading endonuclease HigB of HigAB toxin-antitoxin module